MLNATLLRMIDKADASLLQEAALLQVDDRVLSVRLNEGLLHARTRGNKVTADRLYDVYIDLKTSPPSLNRCTCEQLMPCVHAIAAILDLQVKSGFPLSFDLPEKAEPIETVPEEIIDINDYAWYSESQSKGQAFFVYQLGILIDGKQVNVVPLIVDLLKKSNVQALLKRADDELINIPLHKNKVLSVKLGRIKPLIQILFYYSLLDVKQKDVLKLHQYELFLMQEVEKALQATQARFAGTEILRERLRPLISLRELPSVEVPKGLVATLRDYQKTGLNWLQFLREHRFSGILADDMGLGKTIQMLAHLQYEKEQGRFQNASLILAPTSLMVNWFEEAKRFTPSLKVLIYHGKNRDDTAFDEYDIVLSTYHLAQRDKKQFLKYNFYYLILDEAQFIKNAKTKTTQVIQQLKAEHRCCLTGTPLENHLGELWSLFHFLMPGLLGDARQFTRFFRIPIEKHGDLECRNLLLGRIQPFILRRAKNEVAEALPPKTEIIYRVELEGSQRDLYEAIRMSMEKRVREVIAAKGLGRSQIVLLDALLRLRQVCCDPMLLDTTDTFWPIEKAKGHSAKLDALMVLLDNLMEERRSVLVFSQFTSMLRLIETRLNDRNYSYLKLTGQSKNRHDIVLRFQKGEAPIFLISLKAGGTGLNLPRADNVILYDPWWNPAVEDQAAARSHRIGQINPVFIYKLIVSGTVEDVMLDMQLQKRQLVEGILSNQQLGTLNFTEDDLEKLFTPLNATRTF